MKERIKKFFKNRKPSDVVIAAVPACIVGIYAVKHSRGLKVMSGDYGKRDDGLEVLWVNLANGSTRMLSKPPTPTE